MNIPSDPIMAMQSAYRTAYLIAGVIQQSLTAAEQQELEEWLAASERNQTLYAELIDEGSAFYAEHKRKE